ncbi:GntR family transcriptional regulator [Acidovorax sp. sif1233]|uniref:GntR family transcriptional regulator n=1 Tax=unclassified Acidovorax TaxID=2684926 RepID=UPI001C436D61|nr:MULTISPECIES: GntR family transcriptional regulator [unclassified Acidovorax]MBV7430363.1 GntR family transcriptional regulator [Acidovorax sp. sif0732]MBV7451756.1 GntR family transcriptional regulator [Acidovorax sp. sif0715]MBV7456740.1 GntR family transcriptional regulator [Acidovorax sp. sif1233]
MRTLAQDVTETLRNWILNGEIRPDERLEEIPLAEKLGVSRTPVRAALSTLASEGLVDHQPKRGYLVRGFNMEEIVAAYEVRAVLEGLACRNAAMRGLTPEQAQRLRGALADGDRILALGELRPEDHEPYQQMNVTIHDTLLEASGNPWVTRFAEQAQNIPFASDRIILWDDHPIILRSHGDHHRIIEAVIARDCVRAEQLMREHVYYAGLILRRNYEKLLSCGDAAPGAKPPARRGAPKD